MAVSLSEKREKKVAEEKQKEDEEKKKKSCTNKEKKKVLTKPVWEAPQEGVTVGPNSDPTRLDPNQWIDPASREERCFG